ncbi:MAG: translocation/assembly module TamB [Prevotellaceae bacterium]|nr:translocation/assembly module TamB [Prevotellaceae bacterium]
MLCLYIGLLAALNIPKVQQTLSARVAGELSRIVGSEVSIGNIDLGLLNRIIIDDLSLPDRSGKEMLRVSRMAVHFELLPLLKGRISISTARLYGFSFDLNRATPDAVPNYQFVLDAFASKDTLDNPTDIDLRINSLRLHGGSANYHVLSEVVTPGLFNPQHLQLRNIIANISLKALRADTLNAAVKRMSVDEELSGFDLRKLTLKVTANRQRMRVENFAIDLPHTRLAMDTIFVDYKSPNAWSYPTDSVQFSLRMLPSSVTPRDLAPFVPAFAHFREPLRLEVVAGGTVDRLDCSRLAISAGEHFRLRGNVELQELSTLRDAFVYGRLSSLYADSEGIDFFFRNLVPPAKAGQMPVLLRRLGTVSFSGEATGYFTDLVMYGRLNTGIGNLHTDIKLSSNFEKGTFAYSGDIDSNNFRLDRLLDNGKLGGVTFNVNVNGRHDRNRYPDIVAKGVLSAMDYSGYTYENITLDGAYQQGGFSGTAALNDDNGTVHIDGSMNTAGAVPVFDFRAVLAGLRPDKLHLSDRFPDAEVSAVLSANFTGGSIDDMIGEINLDSLYFAAPDKYYFLDNLKVTSTHLDEHTKRLTVHSPFLRAGIEGDYSYRTLPVSMRNILHRYLPTLIPAAGQGAERANNFSFDVDLYDAELLSTVFDIPLKIYTRSTVKGYFNDRLQRLSVEGYFPRLMYKEAFIESGIVTCQTPADHIRMQVRFTNRRPQGAVNLSLEAQAKADNIETVLNWGNSSAETYSGQLSAVARFVRRSLTGGDDAGFVPADQAPAPLQTLVDIRPTDIILNDTVWQLHPSQIEVDSGRVHIRNFLFSHQDRYLRANGTVSDRSGDTVRVDLNDINIGYVFDIARVGLDFSGEASGTVYARSTLKDPVMYTDLRVRRLGLNEGLLGDARIHGEWHNDVKGIYMDADIREGNLSHSRVNGYIHPLKPESGLDLQITADSVNVKFIEHYIRTITPEFNGRASGGVRLYGKFNELNLDGRVYADASMKVAMLNTTFLMKDSLLLKPDGLTFADNRLFDTQGNTGRLSGYVHYEHFKNVEYNLSITAQNMLVMNTTESPDFPFYGTFYGSGNVTLSGNERDGLNVTAAVTTERNTNFVYLKDNVSSAASNQFVTFVDKTPRRVTNDSINLLSDYELAQQERTREQQDEQNETPVRLNLLVEATPDATMKILMDPVSGDYLSGRGTGNIRTEFYNKSDDFKMFGSYRISQGVYKFSLQEVIRKDFTIQDGSSITFSGDPLDATLDIQALYGVNSVSLNDLIPNASSYVNQTNIKVNCTMNLVGQLTSPTVTLGLDVPTERDEVKALIRNYIPTDEQMSMQILYLLALGKFSTPENVAVTQNSDMMSSVLSSALSSQLNNVLSQVINSNNWNFGTNFNTGEGWTDMEVEGLLSATLLNNRLLINGNFGYRENPLANTNFVGDFEAEWLVTRNGDIRLKAYNETNDRYYTKTNLTTQGIGIVFKRDFGQWRELLFWNKHRIKALKEETDSPEQSRDEMASESD